MFKLFKKFKTKLFLGILFIILITIFVVQLILVIGDRQLKNTINNSNIEVEKKIEDVSSKTLYDNYRMVLELVATEEANALDYVFDSIDLDLDYLAEIVGDAYKNKNKSDYVLKPPSKVDNGEVSAQLIIEQGVNQNSKAIKDEIEILNSIAEELILNVVYSDQVSRCYVVTESGIMVMADNSPSDKYDENGNLKPLTHIGKEWYENAIKSDNIIMSDVVIDILSNNKTIVLLRSFKVNGVKKGVIAFEVYTNLLTEKDVGLKINDEFSVFVFDKNGGVVFTNEKYDNKIFDEGDTVEDYVLKNGRRHIDGKCIYKGKSNLIHYMSVDDTDWTMAVLVDEEKIKKDIEKLSNLFVENNEKLINNIDERTTKLIQNVTVALIILLIISFALSNIVSNSVSHPLNQLIEGISASNVENLQKIEIDDKIDEFKNLSITFNGMIDKIKHYVDNIELITGEKEAIKAELNVARTIQQDMLPKNFDRINLRKDINISAINIPEDEVGGDFYNYILVNNKLYLIIADVSGSGIPAALFMARANYLINSAIKLSNSPKVILSYVNSELAKKNEENYFVTISIYYIDLNTRKVISANAGHENPIIIKKNNEVVMLTEKKNAPIATKEGLNYEENEFTLEEGDALFLYTDGVVEAINDKNELYGEERLLKVLDNTKDNSSDEIIEKVKNSVSNFSNVPDQYDDITMLCFKFNDLHINYDINKIYRFNKEFDANYDCIEKINTFIEDEIGVLFKDDERVASYFNKLEICTEEIVVNIIDHAYNGIIIKDLKKVYIELEIDMNINKISITYIDNGPEFNPINRDNPNILKSAKDREIGGLGIFITKQVVDDVEYEYVNNQNKLKLIKFI